MAREPFGGIKNGDRFGRLVAMSGEMTPRDAKGNRKSHWLCKCDCGNESKVVTNNLKNGHTRSCGCLVGDTTREMRFVHGMSKRAERAAEYGVWSGINTRCFNKNSHSFHHYGGRGITVCDRWRNSFTAFLEDMGPRPSPQHSIDRWPNNDGNYEPGNCRWATRVEQVRNRRVSVILTDEQVRSIRSDNRVARLIAADHGIDRHYVSMIKTGKVQVDVG